MEPGNPKLYWIFIAVNFCIAAIYLAVLRNLLVSDKEKPRKNSMKKEQRKVAVNFQRGSRLSVQTAADIDDPSSHKASTSSDV